MKHTLALFVLLLVSCKTDKKTDTAQTDDIKTETSTNNDVKLEIHDFNGLEPYLTRTDDKIYVVNFWATWCAPCIKELPHFEALNANYKGENVEVILVSLDFPHQFETKLKPYIKEHDLKSKILVLDDVDMNTWIPKVDENWDGAIPVTIIYNKDKRKFYDQTFTYDVLENELKQFLK
ncbi:TlpA family protein disulfide reductase [Flavobacteriaceae bacterium S0825]|uniref:TlpA family protein disulfide reductase n=1 Tax=Gaetbulibacter sp. S0825 TaxID=2720084 RepID=UPI001431D940|nr:TlpA disulfide reductase family protein [Gaetbulibacter sp. S0825]MCK0108941.1 TlpA family protein disulfide reductase [Flavobacteriaceae bacterium S0825]NIX64576.1 TlpA family protein disulfide reductase [Gaetbulibacter sp. S0825]